jgi:hypothetical protein
MARSADGAATVLESLRFMYDVGADLTLGPGAILEGFESIGVRGFGDGQEPYLEMAATVLRLLLRHASADIDAMFDRTARDLAELGRDVDREKFEPIVEERRED